MRLLELELENVNSLYGHWRIDFTHQDYVQSPLFAIIGPTGSGKSSLLDAICLALYGRTPRVSAQRAQRNTLDLECPTLSKGARTTRAAVRFQVDGVTYMSAWSRYIKRGGHAVNPAAVELVRFPDEHAREGEVLTTKKQEWDKLIQEITHMNFELFLRSVVLSQGAFAEFLKAKDDERSAILEKITGTEIYSEMSRWIYFHAAHQKQSLTALERELDGVHPLGEQERAALCAQRDQAGSEVTLLREQQKKLQSAILWRQNLSDAEKAHATAQAQYEAASSRLKVLVPERERAQIAQAAQPAQRARQHAAEIRSALCALEAQQSAQAEALPGRVAEHERAQRSLQALEAKGEELRQQAEALAPLMREVALRRAAIQTEQKRQEELVRREAELNRALLRERKRLTEASEQSEVQRASLLALFAALGLETEGAQGEALLAMETLPAELNTPLLQAEVLDAHLAHFAEAQRRAQAASRSAVAATAALPALNAQVDQCKAALAQAEQAARRAQMDYERAREQQERFHEAKTVLGKMQAYGALTEERALLRSAVAVLQANERLTTAAEKASEQAAAWWQEEGVPELLHTSERILPQSEVALEFTALEAKLQDLETLRAALEGAGEQQAALKRAVRQAEATQKSATEALQTTRVALQQAEQALAGAQQQVRFTQQGYAEAQQLLLAARTPLLGALTEAGIAASGLATEAEALSVDLTPFYAEADRWRIYATQRTATIARARTLLTEQKTAALRRDEASGRVEEAEKARLLLLEEREREQKALEQATQALEALLAGRDLDAQEATLKVALADQSKALKAAKALEQQTLQAEATCRAALETLCAQCRERSHADALAQAALGEALAALGLSQDEQGYEALSARVMPEEEIARILTQVQREAERLAKAEGELSSSAAALERLAALALTTESLEGLQAKASQTDSQLDQALRAWTQCSQRVALDDAAQAKSGTLLARIKLQRELTEQWEGLNRLIGSASGMAFRSIAQKITFRILLREANAVMKTMTKRYTLLASGPAGMSVDVVDHDMGSEVRTSSNLSGGETFMVSLALALALSRLGGRYLSVDTLFLDEGFGTLDEEALNRAIYALETLQATSGKLIGIISHVKMIKERVGLQVLVSPIAGTGRSTLTGSGIERLRA